MTTVGSASCCKKSGFRAQSDSLLESQSREGPELHGSGSSQRGWGWLWFWVIAEAPAAAGLGPLDPLQVGAELLKGFCPDGTVMHKLQSDAPHTLIIKHEAWTNIMLHTSPGLALEWQSYTWLRTSGLRWPIQAQGVVNVLSFLQTFPPDCRRRHLKSASLLVSENHMYLNTEPTLTKDRRRWSYCY